MGAGKPSLQAIAAMPLSESRAALRRFYDPHWGRFSDGEEREVRVSIDYEVTRESTFSTVVTARSAEEAENIAREMLREGEGGDVDIWQVRLSEPNCREQLGFLESLH